MGNENDITHTELHQIHSLTILLDQGMVSGFGARSQKSMKEHSSGVPSLKLSEGLENKHFQKENQKPAYGPFPHLMDRDHLPFREVPFTPLHIPKPNCPTEFLLSKIIWRRILKLCCYLLFESEMLSRLIIMMDLLAREKLASRFCLREC